MSPVAGLHEFAPQLAFLAPELSSIIPGGLRTTGLWSFMTLIPPGVLRFTTRPFYIFTGIHLRTAALSQSPALCYFAIGHRTVFLIVVHAIALEMSVIISGQLLTLLLRGHFSPQYFPAILDVSAHRRSILEGEDGNKSDKCQQKQFDSGSPAVAPGVGSPGGDRGPGSPNNRRAPRNRTEQGAS